MQQRRKKCSDQHKAELILEEREGSGYLSGSFIISLRCFLHTAVVLIIALAVIEVIIESIGLLCITNPGVEPVMGGTQVVRARSHRFERGTEDKPVEQTGCCLVLLARRSKRV